MGDAALLKRVNATAADLALRLGRYFGQNPRYWMNLQGELRGSGQRSPIIGSPRDGGLVDSGTWG